MNKVIKGFYVTVFDDDSEVASDAFLNIETGEVFDITLVPEEDIGEVDSVVEELFQFLYKDILYTLSIRLEEKNGRYFCEIPGIILKDNLENKLEVSVENSKKKKLKL